MSTTFKITNNDNSNDIALRFWGGTERGLTVRFGFDALLLDYVRAVEIIGENDETLTIGQLFESAKTVQFMNAMESRYTFFSRSHYDNNQNNRCF